MSIIVSGSPGTFNRIFNTIKSNVKKDSPELLVIGGVVAFGATLFSMYKTTLKTKEVVDKANEEINEINGTLEKGYIVCAEDFSTTEEYTKEDAEKDIKTVKKNSAKKIIKAAAPTIVLAFGTLSCFLGADYIRKQRHAALFAAAEMTMHSYENYRKGVIEKYGPEVDQELKYKLHKEEQIFEEEDPKTGKKKKVRRKIWQQNPDGWSDFAKVFDEYNPNYQKNMFEDGKDRPYGANNLDFVLKVEKAANQKLRKQGYLTLNEAYEMLGFEKSKLGQSVGWIFNKNDKDCLNDMHIDFGVFNRDQEEMKAILVGNERAFVVDFNIDTLDIWEGFDDTPLYGMLPGR